MTSEKPARKGVDLRQFKQDGTDVAARIRADYGYDGPLLDLFAGASGRIVNKWHHFIPLYDRYFGRFVGRPVRMLEIGVRHGGSLEMWRAYLGDQAVLFGIDIDERCQQCDGEAGQVRIGSQDDPEFLRAVVDEMGGVDIVLDDGSHQMAHIRASLEVLFPLLSDGGVYAVEDLATAYLPEYAGGRRAEGNFFRYVRALTDDMHHWYHRGQVAHPGIGDCLSGIHTHDGFVALEKARVPRPGFSQIGTKTLGKGQGRSGS